MRNSLVVFAVACLTASPAFACGNLKAYRRAAAMCAPRTGKALTACTDHLYRQQTNDPQWMSCEWKAFTSGVNNLMKMFE